MARERSLSKIGDTYTGNLVNGSFSGYGKFKSKDGWTYEGQFVNGQPEGKGTLTTEANVVYKGTFKHGDLSKCALNGFH